MCSPSARKIRVSCPARARSSAISQCSAETVLSQRGEARVLRYPGIIQPGANGLCRAHPLWWRGAAASSGWPGHKGLYARLWAIPGHADRGRCRRCIDGKARIKAKSARLETGMWRAVTFDVHTKNLTQRTRRKAEGAKNWEAICNQRDAL